MRWTIRQVAAAAASIRERASVRATRPGASVVPTRSAPSHASRRRSTTALEQNPLTPTSGKRVANAVTLAKSRPPIIGGTETRDC